MTYTPTFEPGEYRCPTTHYRIEIDGRKILYAYIRKNACTAFKMMINRDLHPAYVANAALGREPKDRYNINGNMRYFAVTPKALAADPVYDASVFVHRDPVARFVSVYTNKFIDVSGADDIRRNYEALTGLSFEQATFDDFMRYAGNDFAKLDCHLWPQKAHLWPIVYTAPVAIGDLEAGMAALIGPEAAHTWFGRKINASRTGEGPSDRILTDVPAADLRRLQAEGAVITAEAFVTDAVRAFVAEKYASDYAMLAACRADLRTAA